MSTANLNESLDAIIQSAPAKTGKTNRRRKPAAKNGALSSGKLAKKGSAGQKPAKSNLAKATAAAIKEASAFDASKYATRVLVSGMPYDVTENQVKTYFESEIGPVAKCSGSFNSRGQSKGEFAITFRKEGHAAAAQKRFNNTPVDGGKRTIKVELVVPAQVPVSLGDRLKPKPVGGAKTSGATATSANKRSRNRKAKGSADAPVPAAAARAVKAAGGAAKAKKAKRKNKPAKSEAELDAEMDDYYKDEITI